jgi:hypothetical protein
MDGHNCHNPACMLAHGLINDLSVIVGRCDLMEEQSELEAPAAVHLTQIRDVAKAMAEKLRTHQCQLSLLMRSSFPQRESPRANSSRPAALRVFARWPLRRESAEHPMPRTTAQNSALPCSAYASPSCLT